MYHEPAIYEPKYIEPIIHEPIYLEPGELLPGQEPIPYSTPTESYETNIIVGGTGIIGGEVFTAGHDPYVTYI